MTLIYSVTIQLSSDRSILCLYIALEKESNEQKNKTKINTRNKTYLSALIYDYALFRTTYIRHRKVLYLCPVFICGLLCLYPVKKDALDG